MATSYDVSEPAEQSKVSRFLSGVEQRVTGFGRFLYNDGKVMGRTGASWGKIGFFYLIYYACLAGFFAITMKVFYMTTPDDYPKLQGTDSLLKGNPGLGLRPSSKVGSTLIRFTKGDESSYKEYTDRLTAFLAFYDAANQTGDSFLNPCPADRFPADWDKSCVFDAATAFGPDNPCTEKTDYGYKDGTPCVVLKLNKIYGWIPDTDSNSTGITVNCTGEYPGDKDNIGDVKFFPSTGFPANYYPYLNQKGYRQPLVFVQFSNIQNGLVVQIECRAWANNIKYNKRQRAGSLHLEMLVD